MLFGSNNSRFLIMLLHRNSNSVCATGGKPKKLRGMTIAFDGR